MKADYDVVIMGAGMVGASLAIALLDQAQALDLKIALIEPQASQSGEPQSEESLASYQSSFDSRATALSYGSSLIFKQLNVWQVLQQQAQAIEHIHVSDKGHFGATRLHAKEQNVEALGYVVENHWLGEVLYAHLRQHPHAANLKFYRPASVTRVNRDAGVTQLDIATEQGDVQVSTNLLVMADGGRSQLRESLGISYREEPYHQHALICNLEFDRAHQSIAYERFTDTGPIAVLPLMKLQKRHRSGLIWTLPDDQIEALAALDEPAFIERLQARFGYRAGRILSVGHRVSYPLKRQIAQEQVRAGIVIVGNAAHTLHPIAGQGFNLALRGVASLAEHLIKGRIAGRDLGELALLEKYYQARLSDQQMALNFSDKSMHLFSTSNPLLAFGRDLGLQLLDVCPAAKTVFARSAMGLSSAMPDLSPNAGKKVAKGEVKGAANE